MISVAAQVLVVFISLGLSRYFTGSILTALLWSVIFIMISSSGFLAMDSITSPDRCTPARLLSAILSPCVASQTLACNTLERGY